MYIASPNLISKHIKERDKMGMLSLSYLLFLSYGCPRTSAADSLSLLSYCTSLLTRSRPLDDAPLSISVHGFGGYSLNCIFPQSGRVLFDFFYFLRVLCFTVGLLLASRFQKGRIMEVK